MEKIIIQENVLCLYEIGEVKLFKVSSFVKSWIATVSKKEEIKKERKNERKKERMKERKIERKKEKRIK